MKQLLVTGGCGFIGSSFVRHVIRARPDWAVVNLDKLTYAGNLENVADLEGNERYRFVKGDITDAELVSRLAGEGVDVVVNFAAETHVDRSIADAGPFVRTNFAGTHALLDAAMKHGVGRYVQVSTDEVYGSLGPSGCFTEESPLEPNNPYSATKAGADLLVRACHHTHGLNAVITRCTNNYGPYQFPEKLIPLFVANALEDKPLPLYGDGKHIRDWLFVADHARAIELAIERAEPGAVFNIGGSNELTNLDLTRLLLKELGKPESLITFVKDRPGHDRRYALDSSRAQKELGWAPQHSLKEGIPLTVRWYVEHKDWCDRVRSGEYLEYYQKHYHGRHGLAEG